MMAFGFASIRRTLKSDGDDTAHVTDDFLVTQMTVPSGKRKLFVRAASIKSTWKPKSIWKIGCGPAGGSAGVFGSDALRDFRFKDE